MAEGSGRIVTFSDTDIDEMNRILGQNWEELTMKEVTAYRTDDGSLFDTQQHALDHDNERQAYRLLARAAGRPTSEDNHVALLLVKHIKENTPEALPKIIAALLSK